MGIDDAVLHSLHHQCPFEACPMRVPTKRMASMGQNITTPLQFSIVCIINAHSKPVNSLMVIAAQIQVYTKKNWKVRLMTHCMVGEIGMVYSGPCGCSIVKME